jgi:ribonuclease R
MKRGLKVVVKVDPWERPSAPLRGEVIEVLGESGDPAIEFQAILRRYGLSETFPDAVAQEAGRFPAEVPEDDDPGRMDLRNTEVITIDPDDARDFDDAICVTRRDDGWEAWVHVADVSHYVKPGSPLDREAASRGNSTYLPGKVIPMLPEALSNGLCSLRPAVDRMAFSVRMRFTPAGKVREASFAKTRIRSMARLTYRQALAILEDRIGQVDTDPRGVGAEESQRNAGLSYEDPLVIERVKVAWELASLLRKRRMEAGSLDLDFPEVKIWVDAMGRVSGVERVPHDISHQLIEEFMLVANESVAREIRRRRVPGVYRIHENPDDSRLQEFREKAAAFGLKCGDLTKREEVRKMLAALDKRQDGYALKLEFLKSLKRAVYSHEPLGHYGLAKSDYTHFTSPIRRYADLLVHRVLARERVGSIARLQETAEHISRTERISADAEKEASTLKKLEYFERQLSSRRPSPFAAVVVDVRPIGLIVELPGLVMSGLIHVNAMGGDYFVFDPARRLFRGRRTGRKYHVGMELEVIVGRVDRGRRQVDFVPVES